MSGLDTVRLVVEEHAGVPPYELRSATLDDAGFLADVSLQALEALREPPADFDEDEWRAGFIAWTEEQVRGEIPFSTTSVVELDGEPVGRLRVVRDGQRIELAGIQLLPRVQGHGIGGDIVRRLRVEATSAQVPLELSVERDNHRARALYERLGFVKIADVGDEERLVWQGAG